MASVRSWLAWAVRSDWPSLSPSSPVSSDTPTPAARNATPRGPPTADSSPPPATRATPNAVPRAPELVAAAAVAAVNLELAPVTVAIAPARNEPSTAALR